MSDLSAFLAQNVERVEHVKYAASKRVKDENGKPIEWELRCLTSDEDSVLRKSSTKKVQVPGRKHMFHPETDVDLYTTRQVAACVVFPDLNSAQLQDSWGVVGAEALLKKMLTPGEFIDLSCKIQEINGYDVTFEEQVEEAKN